MLDRKSVIIPYTHVMMMAALAEAQQVQYWAQFGDVPVCNNSTITGHPVTDKNTPQLRPALFHITSLYFSLRYLLHTSMVCLMLFKKRNKFRTIPSGSVIDGAPVLPDAVCSPGRKRTSAVLSLSSRKIHLLPWLKMDTPNLIVLVVGPKLPQLFTLILTYFIY